MNIRLAPDLEAFVQGKVESGRYRSADEVVEDALRLLDEEDRLAVLRAELDRGFAQLDRGEGILWTPETMERLKREAAEDDRLGKPISDVVKPEATPLAGG